MIEAEVKSVARKLRGTSDSPIKVRLSRDGETIKVIEAADVATCLEALAKFVRLNPRAVRR